VLIDGFEDAPLVAGEELLSLPGFWAAYLMWLCETEEDEPDPAWFGVDEADVDAAYEALADAERWPVFRIPFGEDHTAVVLARNLADDAGTEYLVTHPSWGRLGHLATLDGHQAGPGLSWRELIHIAVRPIKPPQESTPRTPACSSFCPRWATAISPPTQPMSSAAP